VYQAKQMRNQNNMLHSALFLVESTVVSGFLLSEQLVCLICKLV